MVLDLGVLVVSVVTLVIDVVVVVKLRPPARKDAAASGAGEGERKGGATGTTATVGGDDQEETEIEAHHVDTERGMQTTQSVNHPIVGVGPSIIATLYNKPLYKRHYSRAQKLLDLLF